MIEVIRLSQKAKDQLVWLKRQTGIMQWNVLCRWGLCVSLADTTPIGDYDDSADSNIEMRWEVFAGEYKDVYMGLIVERCRLEKVACTGRNTTRFVRQHIHRGVARIMTDEKIMSISSLTDAACHVDAVVQAVP